ncbi:kinase-like protein [Trematosphaeria pertusa]|uniref:Kinase-like protein n=1 Tax=Trematosphaeria pertusa TaxID=390896 RepID=A0A6A6J385_9PLEO|nr:kinase-like protein [Trematosphaeria pertusa]KAF2256807.1 kinase-like protein [Trematosphaeria pertusa]
MEATEALNPNRLKDVPTAVLPLQQDTLELTLESLPQDREAILGALMIRTPSSYSFPNATRSKRLRVQIPCLVLNASSSDCIEVDSISPDGSLLATYFVPIPMGIISLTATVCAFIDPGIVMDLKNLVTELLWMGIGGAQWDKALARKPSVCPEGSYSSPTLIAIQSASGFSLKRVAMPCSRPGTDPVAEPVAQPLPIRFSHHQYSYKASSTSTWISSKTSTSSTATFTTASSRASYVTATSTNSHSRSASRIRNRSMAIPEELAVSNVSGSLVKLSVEYEQQLQEKELVQPFDQELNWSGKGQHTVYLPNEEIPLKVLAQLGASSSAIVDKVLCRRIALARKTMRCTRKWGVSDAIGEVYHLQNLRHFHIIQLVGSYLQARNLALLMYPAADCHLGTFLEDTAEMLDDYRIAYPIGQHFSPRTHFLASSLGCLASAVAYVHENTTKHMDIKPQNILVRKICEQSSSSTEHHWWRVYLADFGLSRSFASQDHSQTDGPTSRTPKYCAPEQYSYDFRGRSADIFPLGCVYTEILTVVAGLQPHEFADFRRGDGQDESFHGNLDRVTEWVTTKLAPGEEWSTSQSLQILILEMLLVDPTKRPTAASVVKFFSEESNYRFRLKGCCGQKPEPYVAYQSTPVEDVW